MEIVETIFEVYEIAGREASQNVQHEFWMIHLQFMKYITCKTSQVHSTQRPTQNSLFLVNSISAFLRWSTKWASLKYPVWSS